MICSSCQLSQQHLFPLILIEKRAFHVLDLVHWDFWDPPPITSTYGYRYYAVFIDDFSHFVWFYPFKLKSEIFWCVKSFSCFFFKHNSLRS